MKRILTLMIVLSTMLIVGCQNINAKIGGNITIDLPAGERLIEITWKENAQLWYLTRPRTDSEKPIIYKFRERSNNGIVQGTVTIIEH